MMYEDMIQEAWYTTKQALNEQLTRTKAMFAIAVRNTTSKHDARVHYIKKEQGTYADPCVFIGLQFRFSSRWSSLFAKFIIPEDHSN